MVDKTKEVVKEAKDKSAEELIFDEVVKLDALDAEVLACATIIEKSLQLVYKSLHPILKECLHEKAVLDTIDMTIS
jgi:hypothetical protein